MGVEREGGGSVMSLVYAFIYFQKIFLMFTITSLRIPLTDLLLVLKSFIAA